MKKRLLTTLGLLTAAMTFSTGCLVVTGDEDQREDGCYEDCQQYEVCETYCDPWECWDECWYESVCDVHCPAEVQVDTDECLCDIDCAAGDICVSGTCVDRSPTPDTAAAGLCQACLSTNDCVEEDARCVRLNYEHSSKTGEKICSRVCELDDDCPIGFECVNVSQEVGVPAQCLPKAGEDGERTCTNNAELECVKANECGVGESCVNNECVSPTGAECRSDSECDGGEVCQSYRCVDAGTPECVDRNDCAANEICIDGECTTQNDSCVFNSECDDGKCVDGTCIASCTSNDQCGPYERCRIPQGGTEGLCEQVECRRSSDCAAGSVCVDAVCEQACDANADCGAGFVCNNNGYCETDPNVECRTTAECAANEICNNGACQEACGCNQDCPTDQVCDMDTGTCEDLAQPEPAAECETTCDCPSGQACVDGTCSM